VTDEQPVARRPPGSAGAVVPRTSEQLQELLTARPDGWEFLLFAGALIRGKDELEPLWRDHQLGLPSGEYHRIDEEDVAGYLSAAFGRVAWTIRPIERIFAAQEDVFGKPGEPGDAALIQHSAGWLIEVYRRLLDWAGTVRSADVPEEFELAVELSAQAADLALQRIRSFIDDTVTAIEQLMVALDTRGDEREPIELRLQLILDVDHDLMAAAVDELRRALGQEPDG
jgi:hypothetical protein